MVLGDAVSKLETFLWILSHISRSVTWSLFTLKASYLVKWSILTWSFMWWCQLIDWLKFETRPSSLLKFGTAYSSFFLPIKSRSQGLLRIQNGGQTRSKTISYWTQAKITAQYKKSSKCSVFLISLSLYYTSIPRKYSTFIQQLFKIYFISERFFPKTHEIGRLFERWWEIAKNRKTHGRTVRVGSLKLGLAKKSG